MRQKSHQDKSRCDDHIFTATSPVKSLFEALILHVKLENGSLTIRGSIITAAVLFQKGIKAVLRRVLLTAHEHHWDDKDSQGTQVWERDTTECMNGLKV